MKDAPSAALNTSPFLREDVWGAFCGSQGEAREPGRGQGGAHKNCEDSREAASHEGRAAGAFRLLKTLPFEDLKTYLTIGCQDMNVKQQDPDIKHKETQAAGKGAQREEREVEERQLGTKQKRFELTQKEDEHSIR